MSRALAAEGEQVVLLHDEVELVLLHEEVERDLHPVAIRLQLADVRCRRGSHPRNVHPGEPQRLSVPRSRPTGRDAPLLARRREDKLVHPEPRSCYHEGAPVLVSGLKRTHCGSGACLASPSGDRVEAARRGSLERERGRDDAEEKRFMSSRS